MKNKLQRSVTLITLLACLGVMATGCQSDGFDSTGYTSLFNGEDLSGWKIPEGDNGHWKVVDGVIDYDAQSEAKGNKSLYTEQSFGDFALHIEWRFKSYSDELFPMPTILPNGDELTDAEGKVVKEMKPNADSGILMRGGPQLNLWCWAVGSGELWGTRRDKSLPPEERARAVPKVNADRPVGEWNTFDITLRGDRVTVISNGMLIIDNALMKGIPERGPIGLQHHGGINKKTGKTSGASSLTQYRNIWIKEL
ncbi:MAG: 3-keto-disaccharide hydrolase [Planctomycetota bacterium]|jgi:hypothetical protein